MPFERGGGLRVCMQVCAFVHVCVCARKHHLAGRLPPPVRERITPTQSNLGGRVCVYDSCPQTPAQTPGACASAPPPPNFRSHLPGGGGARRAARSLWSVMSSPMLCMCGFPVPVLQQAAAGEAPVAVDGARRMLLYAVLHTRTHTHRDDQGFVIRAGGMRKHQHLEPPARGACQPSA